MKFKILKMIFGPVYFSTIAVSLVACNSASAPNDEVPDVPEIPEPEFPDYFQVDGKDFIPDEDGYYLSSHLYNDGVLWDGTPRDGSPYDGELLEINPCIFDGNNTVTFEDGDALLMIFNDDNEDGISYEAFRDSVFFNDSSTIFDNDIAEYNASLGNGINDWDGSASSLIAFDENGNSRNYIGGQFNYGDRSLVDQFENVRDHFTTEEMDLIIKHYDYELDENDNFVRTDDWKADSNYLPTKTQANTFTAERVAKNAYQITFNDPKNDWTLDHTPFALYNTKTDSTSKYGAFYFTRRSINKIEIAGNWNYMYTFQTRKDEDR